jgi:hypothetical protein
MKRLLTRVFKRNVLIASVVMAAAWGLTGLAAGPALARTGAVQSASSTVMHGLTASATHGPPAPMPQPQPPMGRPGFPWHPGAELWINIRWSPQGPTQDWFLTCSPNGGTIPDADLVCSKLHQTIGPFTPLSHGVMCPMIDYGPQTATISGDWYGLRVYLHLSRSNGCQEAQWNKLISALDLTQVNPGGLMKAPPPPPPPPHAW